MEWSNILTLIREGEGSRVEVKQIPFLTDSKKIAEQLVSFANRHGGIILVGVKND
jgi:predicted HTH transcriptional regulator